MSEEMYKSMFQDAIRALAEIDKELGLPEDGCNSTQQTITAIRLLFAVYEDQVRAIDMMTAALKATQERIAELPDMGGLSVIIHAALTGAASTVDAVREGS